MNREREKGREREPRRPPSEEEDVGAHSRGPAGRSRAITGVEMGDGDEDIRSDGGGLPPGRGGE